MRYGERFRVAAPEVIHQTIDGEVVLVHLTRGTYHSLRGSGALLFAPLVRGASMADLAAMLAAGTDGEATRIEAAAGRPTPSPSAKQPFEEPQVETFADLQDLLLTDPIHDVESRGWPNVARGGPTQP